MLLRLFKPLLILAIVAGMGLALRDGLQQRGLRAEYRRLQTLVGELSVEDPGKIYLKAIATDDPLHFVWRIYLPPQHTYRSTGKSWTGNSWTMWSTTSSTPEQSLLRFRLRITEDGFQVFSAHSGGTSFGSFGGPELANWLTDPQEQLHIEQLGREGPVAVSLDEVATLLRIEIAEPFREELRQRVDPWMHNRLDEPLIVRQLGTEAAIVKLEEGAGP